MGQSGNQRQKMRGMRGCRLSALGKKSRPVAGSQEPMVFRFSHSMGIVIDFEDRITAEVGTADARDVNVDAAMGAKNPGG